MSEPERKIILVVDDDGVTRDLVRRRLKSGYRFLEAENGAQALEVFSRETVDLVIMDVMMPEVSGFEACREMKKRTPGEFVPVILLTALDDQNDRNQGLAAGADEFLSKPVDWREMKLRVQSLLRLREQDLTIQSHAEELAATVADRTASLEQQFRFTNKIIDSLPVSLHVIDRARTIVAWNRQRELGERGLVRETAIGRHLYDVIPVENHAHLDQELTRVFRGENVEQERVSLVNGQERRYHMRRVPMSLSPDCVTHVITIGEEITEQHNLRNSLRIADKMGALGRLAAGVAHEVNNPLATIATCAEALRGRLGELGLPADSNGDFREYLETIEQEAYRAKTITQDLLDFSRAKSAPRERTDLNSLVERTLQIMKHNQGFKSMIAECELEPEPATVVVERDALVQVLVALVINAVDAMPAGGRLHLTTGTISDEAWCAVRDTGVGIAPEHLPNIFEPFYTTKPVGRGTGLGLSISYGILQSHGGRIDVESDPGQGACFTFFLPKADGPSDKLQDTPTMESTPAGR